MRSRRLRSYAIPAMARVVMPEADMLAIDADGGTYVLAGQDVTFIRSRVMPAAAGSYSLAGQSVELVKGIAMPAAAGAYVLSGQAANFLRNRVMAGDAGAYTVSGKDAALVRSRIMAADVGAYSVLGQDATLTKSGGAISLEWGGSQGQTSAGANPMAFTSVGTGTPSAGRLLVVLASARGVSGATRTITGLTVDGVAATSLVNSGASANPTAIFSIVLASGSASNISLSADGTMSRASVGIAALTNYLSTTPTDTDFTSVTSTSIARPLDISAGGVGLWCVSIASVNDITWTNATERYDVTPGSVFRGSAASYEDPSGSTRTATASWSGSSLSTMSAVSFR